MNSVFVLTGSLASALGTAILCFNAQTIATRLGLLDVPDARKQHSKVTPLMGGVTLLLAFIPTVAVYTLFVASGIAVGSILLWLFCVAAMSLVGLADDRHSLSPRDRLLMSFLVFGSAALMDPVFNVRVLGFETPPFELGLGTGALAIAFTSLCCVGLVNAVNMADGKNGLVLGLVLGWIALLSARAPANLLPILAILGATVAALLVFNLKGRLFLGDGGAYGLATAIGLLSVYLYNLPGHHAGRILSAEELFLIFFVPVFDSFRLTVVRLRRRQSPMSADRDHLHHHLLRWFGWPAGLLVYWAAAFAIGLLGIAL